MTIQPQEITSGHSFACGESSQLSSNIMQIADTSFGHSIKNIEKYADLRKAECRFLFHFPAVLIGKEAECAAAILCRDTDGLRLVYLVLNMEKTEVSILDEEEVPEHLANFSWSFANILSVMPFCDTLPKQ